MPELKEIQKVLKELRGRMEDAVGFFSGRISAVRGGGASPALVEGIKVDYYGTPTPLRDLCAVSLPEPRMLVIRPYDPGAVEAVKKAIMQSDLGVTPSTDGQIVRLVFPPLTEEVRKQLASQVKRMAEEAKVAVRNCRRDANKELQNLQKEGVPEDDVFRAKEEVQEITDEYIKKVEELLEQKIQEIMEV